MAFHKVDCMEIVGIDDSSSNESSKKLGYDVDLEHSVSDTENVKEG